MDTQHEYQYIQLFRRLSYFHIFALFHFAKRRNFVRCCMQLEFFFKLENIHKYEVYTYFYHFRKFHDEKKRHTVFHYSYKQVCTCTRVVSQSQATTYDPKTVHDQSLLPMIPDQLFPQVLGRRLKKVREHDLSVGPYL